MWASNASRSGGSTHQPRLPQFPVPFGAGGSIALAPGGGEKMAERVCGSTNHRIALKGLSSIKESFQRQGLRRPNADAREKDPSHVF